MTALENNSIIIGFAAAGTSVIKGSFETPLNFCRTERCCCKVSYGRDVGVFFSPCSFSEGHLLQGMLEFAAFPLLLRSFKHSGHSVVISFSI